MKISCLLIVFLCQSAIAAIPTPSPSPASSESASPAATITQSVSELSAQRAATERSKIYWTGAAYGHWLDEVAKDSGNAFLQRPVFDRVTWVRLLSCVVALALLSLLTGWFVWIVRQHAGEIESTRYQSWLALSAAAIRKPVALFIWMCCGTFALLPIAAGIVSKAHAYFLGPRAHGDSLRRMDYRAAMADFSRDSRCRKANASVGGANAELTRQNHCSNRRTFIAAVGAAAWNHSIVTAAEGSRKLGVGDTKRCRHSVHRHA